MEKDNLLRELSKYGQIEVFSEGHSFSFLMTGTRLEDMQIFLRIGKLISEYGESKGYCYSEVMKNSETFICIILKPKE